MKWTLIKFASPTCPVQLYNGYGLSPDLGVFVVPLPADGIIIEYDKDREDCKFIPEAPTTPLVSPSYPQSEGQSSDLGPPSLPMSHEGGSPTGSRINGNIIFLTASPCYPANSVLTGPKQESEKRQKSLGSMESVETERRWVRTHGPSR